MTSDIDKILDDFAESIKEIQAERQNDVYYDRNGASQDIDEAYEEATKSIQQLITKEIKQAKLDLLNELYDEAETPEQYDTCDVIHDHRIAEMIYELNKD